MARRFFDRIDPVHAVTYFAPEARSAFDGLGFGGFWMGYFAARSAPFGVVSTEVVTAAFYNFTPERVAKALPAVWELTTPADALRIREQSAVAALRREHKQGNGLQHDHDSQPAASDRFCTRTHGVSAGRHGRSRSEVAVPFHPADAGAAVGCGDGCPRAREMTHPAIG